MNLAGKKITEVKPEPKTVTEAVSLILTSLSEEDQELFRGSNPVEFHHGFRTQVRNDFGLWRDNEPLKQDCKRLLREKYHELRKEYDAHWSKYDRPDLLVDGPEIHADDASTVILTALRDHLMKGKTV